MRSSGHAHGVDTHRMRLLVQVPCFERPHADPAKQSSLRAARWAIAIDRDAAQAEPSSCIFFSIELITDDLNGRRFEDPGHNAGPPGFVSPGAAPIPAGPLPRSQWRQTRRVTCRAKHAHSTSGRSSPGRSGGDTSADSAARHRTAQTGRDRARCFELIDYRPLTGLHRRAEPPCLP